MLVSAALIVRDEEKFLQACLDSLAGLADEIVVVDTGSADRSRDIAMDAGARVYDLPWTGDFSAARNHALSLARGEWILYIDADERVGEGDRAAVRSQLRQPGYIGYRLRLRPRPGFSPYWELRLFRNDPRIRFRGVIHENIWPAVISYQEAGGGRIGLAELFLEHDGYEGDQQHKHLRNQPMLERSLAEDPSRVFSWCHLAGVREALGDGEGAEQAWGEAMRLVRGKVTRQPEDALPFLHQIEKGLADGADVTGLLDEALGMFGSNLQFVWLRGRALMTCGRAAEAISVFQGLVTAGASGEFDQSWAYDLRMFGVLAYEMLAACHFSLGSYGEALRYYGLAAESDPSKLEYRVKAAPCARLAAAG
ncbi:MAG TPA: glycosyltransferase [Streptosporangiaceae bacterium]